MLKKQAIFVFILLAGCSGLDFQPPLEMGEIIVEKSICRTGEIIKLSIEAFNFGGGNLTYRWICTDGSVENSLEAETLWTAPASEGSVTILVFVKTDYMKREEKRTLVIEVKNALEQNVAISVKGKGMVAPGGDQLIKYGIPYFITAKPDEGYHFAGWTTETPEAVVLGDPGEESTSLILRNGKGSVCANFEIDLYTLTVETEGAGTVSTNSAVLEYNENRSITAAPASGYEFRGWSIEDGSGVVIADSQSASTSVALKGGSAVIKALFEEISPVKRDFVVFNTSARSTDPIHIKTNMKLKSAIMYRILVEGYNYQSSMPINSDICGYTYDKSETITAQGSNDYTGAAALSQYYSTDGYVVIKVTLRINSYYVGFSASAWFTNPTGYGFDIQALEVVQQAADL